MITIFIIGLYIWDAEYLEYLLQPDVLHAYNRITVYFKQQFKHNCSLKYFIRKDI